jgi:hypothetical protein
MENTGPLFWYGILVLVGTAWLIVVPYWKRKTDLITAWNVLLLSIGMFVGLGCLEAATSPARQDFLKWFNPTEQEVRWYLAATTAFLIALFGTYYYVPIGKSIAARSFSTWPPLTPAVYVTVIGICLVIQVLSLATLGQTFFGPLFFKLSHKALTFATVFAFLLWYRNRLNPVWFALFCAVFAFSCLSAIRVGTGRRLLLSLFIGPLVCVYWTSARNWKPSRTMAIVAVAGVGVLIVGLMYSSFRHFSQFAGQLRRERTTKAILQEIQGVTNRPWMERFMSDKLFFFGQQNVHYSLLVQRYIDTKRMEPKPFNTLYFCAVYPIPRRIWADKPVLLGITAAIEIARTRQTNWGVGIAGHGAYEGGIPVLVLYAVLLAIAIRFFDEPLKRQPTNPFLIAMLTAASPHILGWTRGDFSNLTMDSAECVLFTIIVGIFCRILFGVDRSTQRSAAYAGQSGRWRLHAR